MPLISLECCCLFPLTMTRPYRHHILIYTVIFTASCRTSNGVSVFSPTPPNGSYLSQCSLLPASPASCTKRVDKAELVSRWPLALLPEAFAWSFSSPTTVATFSSSSFRDAQSVLSLAWWVRKYFLQCYVFPTGVVPALAGKPSRTSRKSMMPVFAGTRLEGVIDSKYMGKISTYFLCAIRKIGWVYRGTKPCPIAFEVIIMPVFGVDPNFSRILAKSVRCIAGEKTILCPFSYFPVEKHEKTA